MKKITVGRIIMIWITVLFAGCGGAIRPGQETETEVETDTETEIEIEIDITENPAFGGEILDDTAILVFADENLREVMEELIAEYHLLRPTVTIIDNYGSSKSLTEQIAEGDACDVFFYASEQRTDGLEEEGLLAWESKNDVIKQGDAAYSAVQITNDAADELERNAAADFIVFLFSDTAKEIYERKNS